MVPPAPGGEDLAWFDPQDLLGGVDHHFAVLAKTLADRLHVMLHDDRPEIVTDKSRRPVEAGDVLILVRSRSPLFRQIIAAPQGARAAHRRCRPQRADSAFWRRRTSCR